MRLTAAVTLLTLGVFPGVVLDLATLPGRRVAVGFLLLMVGLALTIDALRSRRGDRHYRTATAIFAGCGAALWSVWAIGEVLRWLTRL
jgi:hypothetical protein